MNTIAIANRRGGTGKTTSALHLAYALARQHSVLLIELDPLAPCGRFLPVGDPPAATVLDVLCEEATVDEAAVATDLERLVLLPGDRSLARAESDLVLFEDPEQNLRRALGLVAHRFDYAVIDCPPSEGLLATNALMAADRVIVPIPVNVMAVPLLTGQMQALDRMRSEFNPELVLEGVLPIKLIEGSRLARGVLEEIRQTFGFGILLPSVRFDPRLAEAMPLRASRRAGGPGTTDYEALSDVISACRRPPREIPKWSRLA